ncbi:cardiolipin synthase [Desulfitispora alkaliphila]|uniref:cardiolipin synthase n=1 Tax=Desulfitispora alkaliphila TaxID=622674 RepID=UPI003D1F074E
MEYLTTIISILFIVTIVFISMVILLEKRNPSKTVGWLLVLTFLPVLGFILYIFFGSNWRKSNWLPDSEMAYVKKQEKLLAQYSEEVTADEILPNYDARSERVSQLAVTTSHAPLLPNNQVELIFEGETLYKKLFRDIEEARDHIHIVFFIIRNDEIGQKLKNLLIKKAEDGCEVRLIYDHIGSKSIERNYVRQLKKAGIKVFSFLPLMFPMINRRLNYRNHRKIAIIDGKIAYTGGFNLGDEYVGKSKRLGFWRDAHIRICGKSVYNLQVIFLKDWYFVSKEAISGENYFPPIFITSLEKHYLQIVSSGPDTRWPAIMQTYFTLITNANRSVWITTPYLILDDPTIMALKTAVLSGVDVRIIVPGKPDHRTIYFATHSYIEELLEAGVKIYLYQKGFIHSKMLICDDHILSTGSANFNMRSFHIDFEVNALVYNRETIKQAIKQLEVDMDDSIEIDYQEYKKNKRWYRHVAESIARLFSPLI